MQTRGSVFTRARYRLCLTVERFHLKVTLIKPRPSGSLLWGATQQGLATISGCVWVARSVYNFLYEIGTLKFPLKYPLNCAKHLNLN